MTTVRLAKFDDLSAIVALGAAWHAGGSTYDGIPYNAVIARRTVKRCLTSPDSRVWVSVADGKVRGFLIGEIGEMPFSHHCSATDLAFVAEAGGDELLEAFLSWCRLRKVARVDMGVSATKRSAPLVRFFRRHGLKEAGGLYYVNMLDERAKEIAA